MANEKNRSVFLKQKLNRILGRQKASTSFFLIQLWCILFNYTITASHRCKTYTNVQTCGSSSNIVWAWGFYFSCCHSMIPQDFYLCKCLTWISPERVDWHVQECSVLLTGVLLDVYGKTEQMYKCTNKFYVLKILRYQAALHHLFKEKEQTLAKSISPILLKEDTGSTYLKEIKRKMLCLTDMHHTVSLKQVLWAFHTQFQLCQVYNLKLYIGFLLCPHLTSTVHINHRAGGMMTLILLCLCCERHRHTTLSPNSFFKNDLSHLSLYADYCIGSQTRHRRKH